MAVKATPKALDLIEQAKKKKGDDLTKWETVKVSTPTYLPAILLGMSYHLNRNCILRWYSYLNDFYEFLGIMVCIG